MSLPAPKTKGKPQKPQAARAPDRAASERNARVERIEDDLAEARDALRSAERAFGAAERELKRAQQRVSDLEARLEREQARAG
jgi:chromosome segregation ATPase